MKKNFLFEMLSKPFMSNKAAKENLTSNPSPEQIEQNLDDVIPIGFYDDETMGNVYGYGMDKYKKTRLQKELIQTYRKISNLPEVQRALDEIVNEATFSPGSTDIIEMDFKPDVPQEIKDRFIDELKRITAKINLNKNIYSLFLTFYVDGQLNIHCSYYDNEINSGIQKLNILSPLGLNFNYTKNIWEYEDSMEFDASVTNRSQNFVKEFDKEEIIRIDSGIYSDNVILSNLHVAIKPANMLQTLEDMLIPMRFTRSISRRVFNVDVSNLNNKKAEQVMNENRAKFKYKKFYDLNTGTISNQQHVISLTEDYWFPNRSGEKGTTVETLDETGNLGELGDILYFKRKLYTALKIPTNRINDSEPSDAEFDFDTTSIKTEELKFFNFISRLRNQFLELFYELLKRQTISKGIVSEADWEELLPNFKIKFVSENAFFKKMERENFSEALSQYTDIEDLITKGFFSYEYVYKKVLKMSDDEIREMGERIEKEKKDPLYARFYEKSDDEY